MILLTLEDDEARERFDQRDREREALGLPHPYFNRRGEPISMWEWANSWEHEDRHVEKTSLWFGFIWVSTVWLGLNHQYGEGEPLIYETMVFIGGSGDDEERYSTLAQATRGHQAMVRRYRYRLDLLPRALWRAFTSRWRWRGTPLGKRGPLRKP